MQNNQKKKEPIKSLKRCSRLQNKLSENGRICWIMCISYNRKIKPRDNNQEKQTSHDAKNKLMPKLPDSAPKCP